MTNKESRKEKVDVADQGAIASAGLETAVLEKHAVKRKKPLQELKRQKDTGDEEFLDAPVEEGKRRSKRLKGR